MKKLYSLMVAPVAMAAVALAGCNGLGLADSSPTTTQAASGQAPQELPAPYHLLLPKEIRLHPFSGTVFHEAGGVQGIDVRVETKDTFANPTMAFGDFRFELFTYRPNSPDPKGKRVNVWEVPLQDAKTNLLHWDKISRTYRFRLEWDPPIPVGRRYVLQAIFSSPYTSRKFCQRVFISGE